MSKKKMDPEEKKIALKKAATKRNITIKKKQEVGEHFGGLTDYTDEKADIMCDIIASCLTPIRELCHNHESFPDDNTFYKWRKDNPYFAQKYKEAKREQQWLAEEEIQRIANDSVNDVIMTDRGATPNNAAIARARLQIETLKWRMGKMNPTIFGDKMQQELTIVKHEDILKELE